MEFQQRETAGLVRTQPKFVEYSGFLLVGDSLEECISRNSAFWRRKAAVSAGPVQEVRDFSGYSTRLDFLKEWNLWLFFPKSTVHFPCVSVECKRLWK